MIRAGAAQVDITPPVGAELSGFALRRQPSTGLLDPLYAKALHLEDHAAHRLLWIHADLIGLEAPFVRDFRQRAKERWGLNPDQVLLSATHTHAGPATVHLFHAGEYDAVYVRQLTERFTQAADAAMASPQQCELAVGITQLDLAIDRRRMPSSYVDPQLMTLTLRSASGDYLAVIVNYAMHPVALGLQNRLISADFCGPTASILHERFPGNPIVLITNGACGNINPPALNVPPSQVRQWAARVADAAVHAIASARTGDGAQFNVKVHHVALRPHDTSIRQIEAHAAPHFLTLARTRTPDAQAAAELIDHAARRWMTHRIDDIQQHRPLDIDVELFVLQLPGLNMVAVNAEVFSQFTQLVRQQTRTPICTLGYANGVIGYLPTRQAFEEGGYEVNTAMFYYDAFRPAAGSLERLASLAATLCQP